MDQPYEFEQGRTFSFLVSLEDTVPVGFFKDWETKAHLRRYQNRLPSGLLADLYVEPIDPENSNQFLIYHEDTSKWPLGKAEMDFLFIHPDGSYKIPTVSVTFNIVRVVTHLCQ